MTQVTDMMLKLTKMYPSIDSSDDPISLNSMSYFEFKMNYTKLSSNNDNSYIQTDKILINSQET